MFFGITKQTKWNKTIPEMHLLWMGTTSTAGGRIRLLKEGSSSTSSSWIKTTSTGVNISRATTDGSQGTSNFPSSNIWKYQFYS